MKESNLSVLLGAAFLMGNQCYWTGVSHADNGLYKPAQRELWLCHPRHYHHPCDYPAQCVAHHRRFQKTRSGYCQRSPAGSWLLRFGLVVAGGLASTSAILAVPVSV